MNEYNFIKLIFGRSTVSNQVYGEAKMQQIKIKNYYSCLVISLSKSGMRCTVAGYRLWSSCVDRLIALLHEFVFENFDQDQTQYADYQGVKTDNSLEFLLKPYNLSHDWSDFVIEFGHISVKRSHVLI